MANATYAGKVSRAGLPPLYSVPTEEGHVILFIHEQHCLVVILHAFQAEFLGREDRAGIIGIARPMYLLQPYAEAMLECRRGGDSPKSGAAVVRLG